MHLNSSVSDHDSMSTNEHPSTEVGLRQHCNTSTRVIDLTADEDPDVATQSQPSPDSHRTGTREVPQSVQFLRQNLHKLSSAEHTALESTLKK